MRVNSKPKKEVIPLHEPQPQVITKPTIHNVIILDSSGSMRGEKYNAAKEGIILELDELKKDKNANYTNTIIEFGSANHIITHCFKALTHEIFPINWMNASLGMTALYDTVGKTIKEFMPIIKDNEKVLIKIFTDGDENDSRNISKFTLKNLIKEAESKGFTITFEGTKFDTQRVINDLSIHTSNTHTHDNTPEGIFRGVKSRISATLSYSKSLSKGEDVTFDFYSKSVDDNG